eukprot:TRINITY_DN9628_c0_g1_i6.p1 TRINITY_DN9628_c0_g1~~TRINITY_DN9628_c0_g1_i6.p1  ORF type:complete len:310 (-),score=62.83 TRINITY_DN9628_c0_g1_i6:302-1231(-)
MLRSLVGSEMCIRDSYTTVLGMNLLKVCESSAEVGWEDGGSTVRFLVNPTGEPGGWCRPDTRRDGYVWLGTSNLSSVGQALKSLPSLSAAKVQGQLAGETGQIGLVGHFCDPSSYMLEALQRELNDDSGLGVSVSSQGPGELSKFSYTDPDEHPVFGQLKINTKFPEAALAFYRDGLGMRLLSQICIPGVLTLWFLGFTDLSPPRWEQGDIDSEDNRTWLWQQRFTQIEIQHWPGWEPDQPLLLPPPNAAEGFGGFEVLCSNPEAVAARLSAEFGAEIMEAKHGAAPDGAVTVLDLDRRAVFLIQEQSQ